MKTNNGKVVNKNIYIFGILFVVISCWCLYSASIIDVLYLLIVLVYFGRYLYITKI